MAGGQQWSKIEYVNEPPLARWTACSFVYKNRFYVYGGESLQALENDLHYFDPVTRRWHEIVFPPGSMRPSPRYGASGQVQGGFFYMYGGFDGESYLHDFWQLDIELAKWFRLESASFGRIGRCNHSTAILGSFFVAFGGVYENQNLWHPIVERVRSAFASDAGTFESSSPFSDEISSTKLGARFGMAAVTVGDEIYIVGGEKKSSFPMDVHRLRAEEPVAECLVDEKDSISSGIPGRRNHSVVEADGSLYIFGGWNRTDGYLNDIVKYTLGDRSFEVLRPNTGQAPPGDCPSTRSHHCAVRIGRHMYIFGGARLTDELENDMFSLQLERQAPSMSDFRRLGNDLGMFVNDSAFSDVVLSCDSGEQIRAHRIILAARSPYFGAMFASNMRESVDLKVKVPDASYRAVLSFVQYLYSGALPDGNVETLIEVLGIADQHGVVPLVHQCETLLSAQVQKENVASLLEVAELHNLAELQRASTDFVADNFKEVMADDSLRTVPGDLLHRILKKALKSRGLVASR